MKKLYKNTIRGALFAVLMFSASTVMAQAAAPPMVWRHDISDQVEKQRVAKYGVGPYADAQTRLETELQATIDRKRLPEAKKTMDGLVKSQAKVNKTFGEGFKLISMSKRPRKMWDLYLDTPDGKLAKAGASLRIRVENGVAQVNYKPPGAQRFENGMAYRVEAGINVKVDKAGKLDAGTVKFLENTRLQDNPLRHITKQFPGLKARDFLNLQLEIKQNRNMYELQQKDGSGQWVKRSEISLDDVTSRDPSHKHTVKFGRVELEGEHVALQLTASQQAAQSTARPHVASDTTNPAFTKSSDVKLINKLADNLSTLLKIKAAGMSKYAQSRDMLGKKGVKFTRSATMIRNKRALAAKKPAARRTAPRAVKPKPKAPRRTVRRSL